MKLDSTTTPTRIADFPNATAEQLDYLATDPMAASDWAIFDAEFEKWQAAIALETKQAMKRIRNRKPQAGYEFLYY